MLAQKHLTNKGTPTGPSGPINTEDGSQHIGDGHDSSLFNEH